MALVIFRLMPRSLARRAISVIFFFQSTSLAARAMSWALLSSHSIRFAVAFFCTSHSSALAALIRLRNWRLVMTAKHSVFMPARRPCRHIFSSNLIFLQFADRAAFQNRSFRPANTRAGLRWYPNFFLIVRFAAALMHSVLSLSRT